MNMNDWAVEITKREGKKISVSVAQVKEILRIILRDLKNMPLKDIVSLLSRIK